MTHGTVTRVVRPAGIRPRWIGVLALVACSPGIGPSFPQDDDPRTDTPADTDEADPTDPPTDEAPPVELVISEISPTFGTNAGGVELELRGGPFTADAVVEVGGAKAVTLSATPSTLRVRTVKVEDSGWVDVVVTTATDSVTAPRSFQLWEDAFGKTGLYGSTTSLTYFGYGWDDAVAGTTTRNAIAAVVNPVERTYMETWGASIGSCAQDYAPERALVPYQTGADAVTLVGNEELVLAASLEADGWFTADDVPWVKLPGNTTFDLSPIAGGDDWPSFGVPDVTHTPMQFAFATPKFDGNRYAQLGNNVSLTWTGPAADYVILHMSQLRSGNLDTVEEWDCVLPDTGSYTIRSSAWDTWRSGNLLLIQLARVDETTVELPHNRSSTAFASVFWLAAIGEIQ
jgi:hypothetical protein